MKKITPMTRIFIETVGCPKNREDSERMAGLLVASGHAISKDPEEADIIIVNTCGFIEPAKKESINTIFEMSELTGDDKKLIITGCLTQRYAEELFADLPEADAVLGVNDYDNLPKIVEELISDGDDTVDAKKRILSSDGEPGILINDRYFLDSCTTSYLKIAEGCDNYCTYCVIPKIRGPYRSVPKETLIEEANKLAAGGCKELILIAQDVTAYGKDIYENLALAELLRALCKIDGLEWIRLLYCYEERITDELIEVMASEEKICNYIDIPIQHASADILKRMNRASTPDSIRNTIKKLRSAMPDIVIRTSIITGFPGETEEDFDTLIDFVDESKIDRLGVFAFSEEEGTPAANMPDQIDEETAESRREDLMRFQLDISLENNEKQIGRVLDVIADERAEDDSITEERKTYLGRTRGDAPEIDNAVLFTSNLPEEEIIGKIVRVKIVDAMDYDLIGEQI